MSMHIVIDGRIRRSSTGRYTDRLLEHLQKIDTENNYTVLLEPEDPWVPQNTRWETEVCSYDQFSLNPLQQIGFARQLYKLKADLVHFTMTQQPLFYFGQIVTTTHDLTMLRFVRAGTTPPPIFWLKRLMYRLLFSVAHRKSKAIIVPTEYVKQDLIKLQPFAKDKTFVTLEASEPPLKVEGQMLSGAIEPFIMYVGSAFPHKNLYRLVDSLELLLKKKPNLQLVIAGKREFYKAELEDYIATKDYAHHIFTPGFISDEELKWLYKNCAAYVFPSESEGFGLPGLEAMAHGAPVVSSEATCLPEVYGEAAEYFDPMDIRDMSEAIDNVLSDKKLREKLIKNGHKQIKKFSWRQMAKETLEIYQGN